MSNKAAHSPLNLNLGHRPQCFGRRGAKHSPFFCILWEDVCLALCTILWQRIKRSLWKDLVWKTRFPPHQLLWWIQIFRRCARPNRRLVCDGCLASLRPMMNSSLLALRAANLNNHAKLLRQRICSWRDRAWAEMISSIKHGRILETCFAPFIFR